MYDTEILFDFMIFDINKAFDYIHYSIIIAKYQVRAII